MRYSVGSEEKGYFETLVIKSVTDNKVLWKIVAPLFSIVYKKTDESYIEWQRMTTSGTTNDNEWQRVIQRVITNENEWQGVVQWMKKNESEWKQVKESDSGFRITQNMKFSNMQVFLHIFRYQFCGNLLKHVKL